MSTRFLCVKLADGVDRAGLAEALTAALAALPDVQEARCGEPADAASNKSWDLGATVTCDGEGAGVVAAARTLLGERAHVLKTWVFAL